MHGKPDREDPETRASLLLLQAQDASLRPDALATLDQLLHAEAESGRRWEALGAPGSPAGESPDPPSDAVWRLVVSEIGSPRRGCDHVRKLFLDLLFDRFRPLAVRVARRRRGAGTSEDDLDELRSTIAAVAYDWPLVSSAWAGLPASVAFPREVATRFWGLFPRPRLPRITASLVSAPTVGVDEGDGLESAIDLLASTEAACDPRRRAIAKLVFAGRAPDRAEVTGRAYKDALLLDIERFPVFREDELEALFRLLRRDAPRGWARRLPATRPRDALWIAQGALAVLRDDETATVRRHVGKLLGLEEPSVSEAVSAFRQAAEVALAKLERRPKDGMTGPDPTLPGRLAWLLEVGP